MPLTYHGMGEGVSPQRRNEDVSDSSGYGNGKSQKNRYFHWTMRKGKIVHSKESNNKVAPISQLPRSCPGCHPTLHQRDGFDRQPDPKGTGVFNERFRTTFDKTLTGYILSSCTMEMEKKPGSPRKSSICPAS